MKKDDNEEDWGFEFEDGWIRRWLLERKIRLLKRKYEKEGCFEDEKTLLLYPVFGPKNTGPNFVSNFVNYQISTAQFKLSLPRSIFNHNFTYVFLA
ncbi:hypothetical protein MTR_2g005680 [Medicago truncatula]|uniref:Uncharacterized protein n=1 Tax=Medicago truncatula TaxID=3880 RepID=G7IN77_MEDTR|nr:hypothetical protein MTR_2g005680 [Medicago truncatula]